MSRSMHWAHLTASTFFGGPERQMLGLANQLHNQCTSTFLSYSENSRCADFLNRVQAHGHAGIALHEEGAKQLFARRELRQMLTKLRPDILFTHTYKANLIGRWVSHELGIPHVIVSRGWTWENWKVRTYETLDRANLRLADQVVAVSDGQAEKVRRAGVPSSRLSVIRNSARLEAFQKPEPKFQEKLRGYFPQSPEQIVLAAGRLSPEKGFDVLMKAAASLNAQSSRVGFVVFGEGVERPRLEALRQQLNLQNWFLLPGHTQELDQLLPWADAVAIPSFTEGLPNVALEASCAGVPIVATQVGGIPEVVRHRQNGLLIRPGDAAALAQNLQILFADPRLRHQFRQGGQQLMEQEFTFASQAEQYVALFQKLLNNSAKLRHAG